MSYLLEKARNGRTNAIAGLNASPARGTATSGAGARFRSSYRHDRGTFTSTRSERSHLALV